MVDALKEKKLRIAWYLDSGYLRSCPGVERVVREAKEILEKRGHTLIELKVPNIHNYSKAQRRSMLKDQAKVITSTMEPH